MMIVEIIREKEEPKEESCYLGKEKGIFDCNRCYVKIACAKKGK